MLMILYVLQERANYNYNKDRNASDDIADPDVVWARYSRDGCSVRLLHPQRWFEHLADTLAKLEEVFSSCVGCNAYLTPANAKVRCVCGKLSPLRYWSMRL